MAYQDTWIDGATVSSGDRSCADRYAVVREVVARYQRPVTVWDLGANRGYFGLRLASEFPEAVVVMVDVRPDLAESCRANGLRNVVAMTHRLSVEDVRQLSRCVHADVVLALNVLHHMEDTVAAYDAVSWMGRDIVVETPGRGDVNSAHFQGSQRLLDRIEADNPKTIATFPSHVTAGVQRPLLHLVRDKTALKHGYVYGERVRPRGPHRARPHVITCDDASKTITYEDGEARDWHQGVNLWNWLQLGGSYPSRARVAELVRDAFAHMPHPHGDFRPWNVILQGDQVQVIDAGHRRSVADTDGLADTLARIVA
jgi:hypothetical protein